MIINTPLFRKITKTRIFFQIFASPYCKQYVPSHLAIQPTGATTATAYREFCLVDESCIFCIRQNWPSLYLPPLVNHPGLAPCKVCICLHRYAIAGCDECLQQFCSHMMTAQHTCPSLTNSSG